MYRLVLKSLLDRTAAAAGLLLLAPVLAAIALLVRVRLGSPVLFSQIRPGRDGRPFRMWKFRSMTDARGPDGELLPDDQRLPAFGRWLRSTSLDELPELWNVLRGEMSLVGPRPLLMEYLPLYSEDQRRRHEVLPGVTGWAQVQGRNQTTWEDRLRQDVEYVERLSFRLDALILWRTVARVLLRTGVSADGHATMPRFQGTPPAAAARRAA
ncbi:MAG: sugar transferase [Planctomyces sp.]|nr:sugar transferase [Planctomyces sp.]